MSAATTSKWSPRITLDPASVYLLKYLFLLSFLCGRWNGCHGSDGRKKIRYGLLLDAARDEYDARFVIVRRPFFQFNRRMKQVLHALHNQRAFVPRHVHQP